MEEEKKDKVLVADDSTKIGAEVTALLAGVAGNLPIPPSPIFSDKAPSKYPNPALSPKLNPRRLTRLRKQAKKGV